MQVTLIETESGRWRAYEEDGPWAPDDEDGGWRPQMKWAGFRRSGTDDMGGESWTFRWRSPGNRIRELCCAVEAGRYRRADVERDALVAAYLKQIKKTYFEYRTKRLGEVEPKRWKKDFMADIAARRIDITGQDMAFGYYARFLVDPMPLALAALPYPPWATAERQDRDYYIVLKSRKTMRHLGQWFERAEAKGDCSRTNILGKLLEGTGNGIAKRKAGYVPYDVERSSDEDRARTEVRPLNQARSLRANRRRNAAGPPR